MAKTYKLSAQKREQAKKSCRETRAIGRVPGVVYGPSTEPVSISMDRSELLKTYRRTGTAALIDLDVEGTTHKVLVQHIQWHHLHPEMQHIDLYAVDIKKPTTVEVPLVFEGESDAVKIHGGLLMKDHESIQIRCLPTDIPHDIKVDISAIENIGGHITIADLNLDEKFELMNFDPEVVLCSVTGKQMAEEEEEVSEGEEGAEGEATEGGEGEEKKEEGGE